MLQEKPIWECLTAAELGDSDAMRVGQNIYTVGNPLGELTYTMTSGIISALGRRITTDEAVIVNMFQVDAAINNGNSGGPVYNTSGQVIGVVTAKYSQYGMEGLGFAIPINDAVRISNDLIEKGYVTGKAYRTSLPALPAITIWFRAYISAALRLEAVPRQRGLCGAISSQP